MAPTCVPSGYHQSLRDQFYLKGNCRSHKRRQTNDTFSTGTGLERVGITGHVRGLWMLGSPTKIRNKKDRRGSPVASPMPKSVFSGGRKDQLLRE